MVGPLPSSRQVFCAAEGRELVVYDAESDSNAGLPPRARYLVMGVRALKTGPNAAELEVTRGRTGICTGVCRTIRQENDETCFAFLCGVCGCQKRERNGVLGLRQDSLSKDGRWHLLCSFVLVWFR